MVRLFLFIAILFMFSACSKQKRSDKKGAKMKTFIKDISAYAKNKNPDFIIIPQNGIELVYNDFDAASGVDFTYLDAIDGVGIEELFYNDGVVQLDERLETLKSIKDNVKVMVSDYVGDAANISDDFAKNDTEGFIAYPRTPDNYNYEFITTPIHNENADDVLTLADAKNYLYLIGYNQFSSRQEIIDAVSQTNFDVVLIDLFFDVNEPFTKAEIESLKTKANGGKRKIISYINIGAAENYRYYWKDKWKLHHPNWLKKPYDGYKDEIWVKFWKKPWKKIIYLDDNAYIDRIIDAGFDGAYLDNIEAYYFLYFD